MPRKLTADDEWKNWEFQAQSYTVIKGANPGRKSAFFRAVRRAKQVGNDITLLPDRKRLRARFSSGLNRVKTENYKNRNYILTNLEMYDIIHFRKKVYR